VEWIKYEGRKNLPFAIIQLRHLFKSIRPDIVHTHLVDASLAGLIAAKLSGIKRRVHTRHHSVECHTYYPHGVYYDKFISRLSTLINATTEIVRETLVEREGADANKVWLIPYGYDLSSFDSDETATAELRKKYGLEGHYPVVGVISRFVEWKGVHHIIPAFKRVTEKYPKAKLVLANAVGNHSDVLDAMAETTLAPEQYTKIVFEPQVFDLYKNFDIFVHVPITRDVEAFGQTYIEALYSEIPSIFTLSGIAHDFIRDREHALIVPYGDPDAIYDSMALLLEDQNLRAAIIKKGKEEVKRRFSGQAMASEMADLYSHLV
jgi:glycosyltransferase involved in cell wall biosynthesis